MTDREPTMVIVDADKGLIGTCVHYPKKGWKFIPATTSRRPSRKFWKSSTACIPRWAFEVSEEMLTASEYGYWKGRQARATA